MRAVCKPIAVPAITLYLAACGAGDPATPPAPKQAALRAPALTLELPPFFAWAQEGYPAVFAGTTRDGTADVPGYGLFAYRAWSGTGNYLGLLGGDVYLYGPLTDYQIRPVGALAGFTCQVYDCQAGTSNDAVAAQPDYAAAITRSSIATPLVVPEPSPRAAATGKSWFYRYGFPRGWAVADINGDGLDDVVAAPSFFDQKPDLPLEVWINNGDGTFANQTAQWFEGPVTLTGYPISMAVADFNGDRRPDIFISDSGQELWDCTITACPGASNHLLLSGPHGKLRDASAGLANNQSPRFNHVVSAVGDLDGDGRPDLAVPNLGEAAHTGDGVVLSINRGDGTFTDATPGLSDEIGYLPYSYQFSGQRPAAYDRQNVGAVAIADLDGDSVGELVTCSYTMPDRFSRKKTVRISKWNAAAQAVTEAGRLQLSGALAEVAGATVDFLGNDDGTLGCAGIAAGDMDRDGVTDLLLLWERWGDQYLQVMKGLGNWQYEDVTLAAVGDYRVTFNAGGYTRSILGVAMQDVNGDGYPDILMRAHGIGAGQLAAGMPATLINDGAGRFSRQSLRIDGAAVNAEHVGAAAGCSWCDYTPLYGRFFRRGDGRKTLDMLLVNTSEDRYSDPVQERSVTLRALQAR